MRELDIPHGSIPMVDDGVLIMRAMHPAPDVNIVVGPVGAMCDEGGGVVSLAKMPQVRVKFFPCFEIAITTVGDLDVMDSRAQERAEGQLMRDLREKASELSYAGGGQAWCLYRQRIVHLQQESPRGIVSYCQVAMFAQSGYLVVKDEEEE